MYLLYSAALAAAAALACPYFLWQGLRHGKYLASFGARLGRRFPDDLPFQLEAGAPGCIWLHAVSVGEVLACSKLVRELRVRLPGRKILVSATTETGFAEARKRLTADGFFYCPFDFGFAVRRVIARVRPALLVVAETELWPNLLHEVRACGARVAIINARVSDRSFPRYRAARFFFRQVLENAGLLLAQSEEDARRLREIGGRNVSVAGALKYDRDEPPPLPAWLAAALEEWSRPGVLVAGSTADGEEQLILAAWKGRMIVAPRRPERFDEVAGLAGRIAKVARRSQLVSGAPISGDILLLDSVGELASVYRYASVAFVGGSLVPHGGQNPLEPAYFAKPIVVGPYMSNFREITGAMLSAGALRQTTTEALATTLSAAASDGAMGVRARAILDANRGATSRTAAALATLLEAGR